MLHEGPEEVVELVVLIEQVKRAARKLRNDLLVAVYLELLADYKVHQSADQHSRLVLRGLDVDDRAIYELHHLLKQPI